MCYSLSVLLELGPETALCWENLTGELNSSYDTEGNRFNLAEMCLPLLSESSTSGFSASATLQNETFSFFYFFLIRKLIFLIMF